MSNLDRQASPTGTPTDTFTGTLTLLFTDIEGSTALVQRLGAERYGALLAEHRDVLRAAFTANGGREVDTQGDAFFVVFARAADGLAAAIDAQRALAAHPWPDDGVVRVRMGLHTGQPRPVAEGYVGVDLNRAARICNAAHGGQVLLSATTEALVAAEPPPGVRFRDLGEHRLKDLRHAERLLQVVAPGVPDVARSPRTAGELAARDRIIVTDPTAPRHDASRVDTATAVVVERSVAETLGAIDAVIRGDTRTIVLTAEQVRAAASHRPADLTEYRLGRIAEWSQPRYRLDGRFVDLTLLVDQGEESAGGRWATQTRRYDDLGTLLSEVPDPALVLLGPPGSGKSTLLRRLELDVAIEALRGMGGGVAPGPESPQLANGGRVGDPGPSAKTAGGGEDRGAEGDRRSVTFFIQLNQYRSARPGDPPPAPGDWLAERWSARFPDLPRLGDLLGTGRMLLLLDALNEMPRAGDEEYRERVGLWKQFVVETVERYPGTRIVFACRSLDYSAPLSTPALRVPQVQIEAMGDAQAEQFLKLYSPAHAAAIWERLAGSSQLAVFRSPYFLKLLVDQVEAEGQFPEGRAGLFTGLVRQSLRREIERDNPLFRPDGLLTERDYRRVVQGSRWRTVYDLPERGALIPRLSHLAYGMQADVGREAGTAGLAGGGSQVRVSYDVALELVDHDRDEDILKAGLALAVLDEDASRDEILYTHQLVQEYFAARELAKAPDAELVRREWRAANIRPSVRELIETLPPAEELPPLPQTGWEETAVLAAAMAADAEGFVRAIAAANLALAGRCAGQGEVRGRLGEAYLDELRWALVGRSRDPQADLRDRIACGLAAGELGDPRFERRVGPHGVYLMPPLVEIGGGVYPIGEDEPIEWMLRETSEIRTETAHMPRHGVEIPPLAIGQFPVTNAEWRCFMDASGYDDGRWWDTGDGLRWQRGEIANEGGKVNNRVWRKRFQENPILLLQMAEDGRFSNDEAVERWRRWMALDDEGFEAALDERWQAKRAAEPEYWRDARFNHPAQPVVGVCWYEARAYCNWLGAQIGLVARLPTEVEWEAATRGVEGRLYGYGNAFDATKGNTVETHLRRPTPVGVFVEGDTPEGVSDLAGNVAQWTSSGWGGDDEYVPQYSYPYDADDGREDFHADASCLRILRGGAWDGSRGSARAAFRCDIYPDLRSPALGVRVVLGAPNL